MRFKTAFSVLAVALIGVTAVVAQQPGQRGRGGPGGPGGPPGGFGMFGGGGGGFINRMALLRIPEIRKELELADEQVAELEKFSDEMRAKYPFPGRGGGPGGPPGGPGGPGGQRGRRGGNNSEGALNAVPAQWYFVQQEQREQGRGGRGGGGFQLTDEQRAEFEKQQAERGREERAKLAEVLLPHQIKRLTEIFIQQAGANALLDEDVAKELGISDAQKAKLKAANDANRQAREAVMREMFQPGGGGGDRDANRDAMRAKFDDLRKTSDASLLAVLTAAQAKKFDELKGKPFAMPENFGRGGPGGPGGRGPGGRGPGGDRGNN